MQHIENEFKELLQYVCISTPNEPHTSDPSSLAYIQIILQKTVNKKSYFLKKITGLNSILINDLEIHKYFNHTLYL